MADTLKEFLVSIGFRVDANSEKRFESSVRSATLQADLLGRAIAKTAEKVFEGVTQISKSFEQVYWQASRTQATVQGIRAIGYAASQLGSSAESAGASIENFGRQLKWNPGFEGFLKQIGVVTRDSKGLRASTDILVDFANKIRGRSKAEQLGLAEVAGIDLATLEAIQSGTFAKRLDEYNEKVKAQGLNAAEAAKKGAEFTQAMRSLSASLEIVGQKLMSEFAGPLQRFVDAFDKWTNENGQSFVKVIEKLGETLGELATAVDRVVSALRPMWEGFDNFSKQLTGQNGLTTAIEVLIGLKLARWLLGVASAITAVGTAAGGALISGALGRFFSLLGLTGAGAFALGMMPTEANGGEDAEIARRRANGTWGATPNDGSARPGRAQDNSWWGRAKRFFGWGNDEAALSGKPGRTNSNFTKENADALRTAAAELGTSPENLAAVISYETGGTFSPSIRGGKNNRYIGLIQFGDAEQRAYGASQDQTFPDQMKAVVRYLKARGFKPGMSLMDLYSTINAGRPGLYDRSDGNGTVRTHSDAIASQHGGRAKLFLQSGAALAEGGPGLPPLARMNPAALGVAADNAAKLGGGTGAAGGAALTPSIANRGDTTVTINQSNKVEVIGSGDPSLTASQVGDAQRGLGQVLLRDVRGAVR